MEENYLYLVINDQEIFAALMARDDHRAYFVKDSCKVGYSSLNDNNCVVQRLQDEKDSQKEYNIFLFAIEKIAEELDLSFCNSALVLFSTNWVNFRTICFPFNSTRKIRQVLDLELEGQLPPEKNYISDFYPLGQLNGMFNNFTGSVAKKQVESCLNALKNLDIAVKIIAPFACAVAQGFVDSQGHKDNGILIIQESERLVFVLIWNGVVQSLRSRPYKANGDNESLSKQFGSAIKNKNNLKTCWDFHINQESQEMIKSHVIQIIAGGFQEFGVNKSLPVFLCMDFDKKNETTQTIVKSIAEIPGVEKVEVYKNWESLPISISPHKHYPAMIQFSRNNYIGFPVIHKFFKYSSGVVICYYLLAAILGISFLGVVAQNTCYTKAINKIDAQAKSLFLETFPATKKIQDPYLQMKAMVTDAMRKGKLGINSGNLDKLPFKTVEILNELSTKINSSIDVVITRLFLRDRQLILKGITNNFNDVDKMKTLMESSILFQKVEISTASVDKKDGRIHFRFIIEI